MMWLESDDEPVRSRSRPIPASRHRGTPGRTRTDEIQRGTRQRTSRATIAISARPAEAKSAFGVHIATHAGIRVPRAAPSRVVRSR